MTFNKILVALDGSKNSQIAAEYGFWLASDLEAQLTKDSLCFQIDSKLAYF